MFGFFSKNKKEKTNADGQPTIHYARSRLVERNIDELIGLCKGVIFDGVVDQQEAEMLLQWLETNRHAANKWPANILYERISAMLEDGILDNDEQAELLDLIVQITGPAAHVLNSHSGSTTLPTTPHPNRIEYHGNLFCLTGKFVSGTRKQLEDEIIARGGKPQKSPTKKTYCLIIGEIGSRDWIHSTFGRKIERAAEINENGGNIHIITEQDWIESLQ